MSSSTLSLSLSLSYTTGVIVYDRISLSEGVAFDPFFMGMTLVLYVYVL